jgi:hypothetical protein
VNELLDDGEMLWFHIGNRRMVPVSEVESFVDRAIEQTRHAYEVRSLWHHDQP